MCNTILENKDKFFSRGILDINQHSQLPSPSLRNQV